MRYLLLGLIATGQFIVCWGCHDIGYRQGFIDGEDEMKLKMLNKIEED